LLTSIDASRQDRGRYHPQGRDRHVQRDGGEWDYFTDDALGNALDHLGTLKQTFDIAAGGYQIRMKAGKITQKFGSEYPAALKEAKKKSQGRAYWREITMALTMF
jgi:hypothetical protein